MGVDSPVLQGKCGSTPFTVYLASPTLRVRNEQRPKAADYSSCTRQHPGKCGSVQTGQRRADRKTHTSVNTESHLVKKVRLSNSALRRGARRSLTGSRRADGGGGRGGSVLAGFVGNSITHAYISNSYHTVESAVRNITAYRVNCLGGVGVFCVVWCGYRYQGGGVW